jgi:hypothetical protein
VYILVEERLTKSQRIPQASHAVAEFINYHRDNPIVQDWIENHRTMVCLKATSEQMDDLLDVYGINHDLPVMPWYDDDLPEDVWPHSAVYGPMTKKLGDTHLSNFKLA